MKLGIFINQHIFFDGKNYTCDYHTLLPFTFSLLEYFECIDVSAPVLCSKKRKGRNLIKIPDNIKIIHLPYYEGPLGVLKSIHKLIPVTFYKSIINKKK